MKKLIIFCAAAVLFGTGFAKAGTWTTLDYPGAIATFAYGIDGGNIVGSYSDGTGTHGFLYNGSTWTTFNAPGAHRTYAHDIDGSNIVGYYVDSSLYMHGFRYDGAIWAFLDAPNAEDTSIYGISGNNLVGYYDGGSFLYDGTTWTTLRKPRAARTFAYDIDGSNIVGYFQDAKDLPIGESWLKAPRGFLYDGTIWTTLDAPGAPVTSATGIDGINIVGYCPGGTNTHGFLYNGTVWTILDVPGAIKTRMWGIDDNKLVGDYQDASGKYHGFIYEIPRPIACIADINETYEAQGPFGANIILDGSCSSDADSTPGTNDDITDFNWYEIDERSEAVSLPALSLSNGSNLPEDLNKIFLGSGQIIDCNLPLGTHTIMLEVTDKTGMSDSNEITITVQDTTPPEFSLSVSPTTLWPVNNKMVKITPVWTVTDLCDQSSQVSLLDITTNEPANPDDIQILSDGSIYLRAARSGNDKTGRIYTLTCQACDASGNCTFKTAIVTVPHDMRK